MGYFEQKKEYVRVCDVCKHEREEYLKKRQDEFGCYDNGTMVFKGTEEEKMDLDDMDDDDDEDDDKSEDMNHLNVGSYSRLMTQTTFDITKNHQMSSQRMSKRRIKM